MLQNVKLERNILSHVIDVCVNANNYCYESCIITNKEDLDTDFYLAY